LIRHVVNPGIASDSAYVYYRARIEARCGDNLPSVVPKRTAADSEGCVRMEIEIRELDKVETTSFCGSNS
jgi:hypothetical protein